MLVYSIYTWSVGTVREYEGMSRGHLHDIYHHLEVWNEAFYPDSSQAINPWPDWGGEVVVGGGGVRR